MKQLFMFFMSVCLVGALNVAQAQISLEILDAPDTVHVSLDTLSTIDVQAYWDVTNVGEESLDVLVTRSFMEMADPFNFPYVEDGPGSYERFCWGPLCYPFGTVASADQGSALVTLAPADTNDTFKADFYPNGVSGVTTIKYCYQTPGNASNAVCHEVTFVVDATSDVTELSSSVACSLMPNPATDVVTLSMDRALDGVVEFRNLVGQVAMRERIQPGVTQQAVSLDGLTEGLWLVSVAAEGRVLATQRLVIR
jgi:hypothetical protein